MEADGVAMAAEAQSQLTGGLGSGVEVLVEPALGRAVDAA